MTWVRSLSLTSYCLLAGAAAFFGAIVLAGSVFIVSKALHLDFMLEGTVDSYSGWENFGAIVFAPILETFLLAGMLKLLLSWELSPLRACVTSAVLWGVMHGVKAPVAIFGPTWGFMIFGAGYLLWRPVSFRHAFAAAAVPHAISNTIAVLTISWLELQSSGP